jgi:hypothetical protein
MTGLGVLRQRSRSGATGLGILCLILLLSASLAAAGNRRGFAGFYQARKINGGSNSVQVTLSIRIFNYTTENVSHGNLKLRDSLPPHKVLGSLGQVSVDAGASAQVNGDFVIPRSEIMRWQKGGHPELSIEFRDNRGNPQSHSVELVRGHARIEER